MRAADGLETLVVQRVVGNVVLEDVTPDVLVGPVGEGRDLVQAVLCVPPQLRDLDATGGMLPAHAGDPRVRLGERLAHRNDLADLAAAVRIVLPELGPVELLLPGGADALVDVDLDPVALL